MANALEYFGAYPVGPQQFSTAPVDINSGSLVTVATLSSGGPYIIDEIWFSNASGSDRFVNQISVQVDGAGSRDIFAQSTADDFPLQSPVFQTCYLVDIFCDTITIQARASGTNTLAWITYSKVANKVFIPKGDKLRAVAPVAVGGGSLTTVGSVSSGGPFLIDALYLSNQGTSNKVLRQIQLTVNGTSRDIFNDVASGDYTVQGRFMTRYDIGILATSSFSVAVQTDSGGPGMVGWFTYKVM
jgi:hypothetical protein